MNKASSQLEGGEKMKMENKERDELVSALSEFVIRVAKGGATSESEVAVLPEVAKILLVSLLGGL